jgi:hypothetical protein
MANISNISIHNGAISREDTLPYRVYSKVYQKAQAIKEEKLATAFETERLEYGLAILEVLLGVRFLFDIFNASSLNLLAKLVHVVTFPFTAPFWGLFGRNPSFALSRGELQTLSAMLIYPLIVWTVIAVSKMSKQRTQLN